MFPFEILAVKPKNQSGRLLYRGAKLPETWSGSSTATSSTSTAPKTTPRPATHPERQLRIAHDQGAWKIGVYNRAILLSTTDSEAVRRIHRVCCRLDDLATRHRRA